MTSPHSGPAEKKVNPRLISFFLQSVVMLFLAVLFLLFIGAGITFILIIHFRVSVRNRHHHHHHPSAQDDEFDVFYYSSAADGLSAGDVEKLPCSDYRSILDSVSVRDCSVCLEPFQEGEIFRILPLCHHVFHANCIDLWLTRASACPICRHSVVESDVYS